VARDAGHLRRRRKLLLALVYMILAELIVLLFKWFESRIPARVA
jgi:ABC-type arginine/histidine transport system permease subunit